VSFGIDNFAMFRVKGADRQLGQQKLAAAILDKTLQSDFNVIKGSVPARMDVPDTAFDDCGKKGIKDLAEASRRNTLVGTIAFGHGVASPLKERIWDIVDRHFNGRLDDTQAAAEMAALLRR
jgi:glucose/mannose transport system substrate-binding protein